MQLCASHLLIIFKYLKYKNFIIFEILPELYTIINLSHYINSDEKYKILENKYFRVFCIEIQTFERGLTLYRLVNVDLLRFQSLS